MHKKVKLINHDCLPILLLLHIMLAYIMLLAALSNAVCLHNAFLSFLPLIFANAFCFMPCLGLLTQSSVNYSKKAIKNHHGEVPVVVQKKKKIKHLQYKQQNKNKKQKKQQQQQKLN